MYKCVGFCVSKCLCCVVFLCLPVSEQETESMIKLRSANEALFTGRKHSAKPAWRFVLQVLKPVYGTSCTISV